ncbi:MAG: hypothetical protein AB1744_08545, partial [Candidatus Zixiibacteriota bacterium]
LNVNLSYALSEETRHARGITYLQVEPGQGNFIRENDEFVPDPDGDFIRIEEILSDRSRVSRGEKSFHISRDFRLALLRFNSVIQEELLQSGRRDAWWAVPFLSDVSQPYLFYSRRYDLDVRLVPVRGGHGINLVLSEDREIRDIAGDRKERRDAKADITFKQAVKSTFFEERLELFESDRDVYFAGGGISEGFDIGTTVRQLISSHEISGGANYRRAESDQKERSELYAITAGSRLQLIQKGEIRTSIELYHQSLTNIVGAPSFQLTGNHPGEHGAIWSVAFRYGLRGNVRINLTLSGRHADDRTARVTGRGEMVVGF